jgi:O6-methylguanine-DNA--protein-cysteine methyltransferase
MKRILFVITLCSAQFAHAQKMGFDLFVRLPQVVNYNFTKPAISYAPLISTGLTLRYKKAFADVGSFIGNTNVVGHYIIGTNGDLTGYGGGLPRKKWMIDFEKENS